MTWDWNYTVNWIAESCGMNVERMKINVLYLQTEYVIKERNVFNILNVSQNLHIEYVSGIGPFNIINLEQE
jgi:hypothetical protein